MKTSNGNYNPANKEDVIPGINVDDTIPKPLFANHDEALKWANRRLSKYAEVRSVALILKAYTSDNLNDKAEPNNDMAWSINIKQGKIQPDAKNITEFNEEINHLIGDDATLTNTTPTVIWLPNAIKYIWAINLVQPNRI